MHSLVIMTGTREGWKWVRSVSGPLYPDQFLNLLIRHVFEPSRHNRIWMKDLNPNKGPGHRPKLRSGYLLIYTHTLDIMKLMDLCLDPRITKSKILDPFPSFINLVLWCWGTVIFSFRGLFSNAINVGRPKPIISLEKPKSEWREQKSVVGKQWIAFFQQCLMHWEDFFFWLEPDSITFEESSQYYVLMTMVKMAIPWIHVAQVVVIIPITIRILGVDDMIDAHAWPLAFKLSYCLLGCPALALLLLFF